MSFCKVCTCGEKIVFERRLGFPDNCPSCGRRLIDFQTYAEDDPRVEELLRVNAGSADNKDPVPPSPPDNGKKPERYFLKLQNGKVIPVPDEGGIVGRTELGAEELAEFSSVSRQHLKVTVKKNIGVLVEDISRFGTLVDGQRLVKNEPTRVANGARITLCNVEAELLAEEAANE